MRRNNSHLAPGHGTDRAVGPAAAPGLPPIVAVVALGDPGGDLVGDRARRDPPCLSRCRRRRLAATGHRAPESGRRAAGADPAGHRGAPGRGLPVHLLQRPARTTDLLASRLRRRPGRWQAPPPLPGPHRLRRASRRRHRDGRSPGQTRRHRRILSRGLLAATAARPVQLNCFGMHEWAMVYRSADVRHDAVPLGWRGRHGTGGRVPMFTPLRCTHFDVRFFTDAAAAQRRTSDPRIAGPGPSSPAACTRTWTCSSGRSGWVHCCLRADAGLLRAGRARRSNSTGRQPTTCPYGYAPIRSSRRAGMSTRAARVSTLPPRCAGVADAVPYIGASRSRRDPSAPRCATPRTSLDQHQRAGAPPYQPRCAFAGLGLIDCQPAGQEET